MEKEQESRGLLGRNLLVTFIISAVLLLLYITIPGYHWAITDMAIHNKELIDRIETRRLNMNQPELTLEDKRLLKISNYWYMKYLRENTPENAVILLPPHSVIDSTPEMRFLNSAEWVEYFIFPRLCVGEDEKATGSELFAKVTHVAIVNGWGYDKLHYAPKNRLREMVLPIDSFKK
jgi:hypothetical protein